MDARLTRRSLLLAAAAVPVALAPRRAWAGDEPFTARVFATREGLVGGTTASGHVIVEDDRFVALPSRTALGEKVTVSYGDRSVTVPVLDVGPWNIDDDWWNTSDVRERWGDLPRGTPQAQAAWEWGYNGGEDGKGRRVRNPAGIDLADGVFWGALGMSGNDWVEVTFPFVTGLSTVRPQISRVVHSCVHKLSTENGASSTGLSTGWNPQGGATRRASGTHVRPQP